MYALMQYLNSFRWFGQSHPIHPVAPTRSCLSFQGNIMSTWSWPGFLRGIDLSQRVFRLLDIPPKWIIIESYEVRLGSQQKMECNWMCATGEVVGGAPRDCCSKFLLSHSHKSPFRSAAEEIWRDQEHWVRNDLPCCTHHINILECKQNRGRYNQTKWVEKATNRFFAYNIAQHWLAWILPWLEPRSRRAPGRRTETPDKWSVGPRGGTGWQTDMLNAKII